MSKPITRKEWNKLVKQVRDTLRLASTHDPDHEARLSKLERAVTTCGLAFPNALRKAEQRGQGRASVRRQTLNPDSCPHGLTDANQCGECIG
jgi:predicted membrane chloride channel (bestrophin family)